MHLNGMDHIVLNVRDVERSLDFYTRVLGLAPERVDTWRAGKHGFPSVRINDTTIIDLMVVRGEAPAGTPNLNHFCLYTDGPLEPCIDELEAAGVEIETGPLLRWGARGDALSVYFRDPDKNQIEIRSYVSIAQPRPEAAVSAG